MNSTKDVGFDDGETGQSDRFKEKLEKSLNLYLRHNRQPNKR